MKTGIHLKQVLANFDLDGHGIIGEISDDTLLHRHTIARLYHNTRSTVSLKVIGEVCDWLISHNVPADILPGALFGAEASNLWHAAAKAGIVSIYLGEFQQVQDNAHIPWISRQDAALLNALVEEFSTSGVCGASKPKLAPQYVPFRVDESAQLSDRAEVKAEHTAAVNTYRKICRNLKASSAILIGSQRINRLVEAFVADLFDCQPFVADSRLLVPFYLAYQSRIRPVESCFGGLRNPPGRKGTFQPGIHYLDSSDEWDCIPWVEHKQDSGVVITSHEPGTGELMLAIFGLRGRATETLGKFVIKNPDKFWTAEVEKQGKKIGVYICKITYPPKGSIKPGEPDRAQDVQVIPLDETILTKYLKGKSTTTNPAKAAAKTLKSIVKHLPLPGSGNGVS